MFGPFAYSTLNQLVMVTFKGSAACIGPLDEFKISLKMSENNVSFV